MKKFLLLFSLFLCFQLPVFADDAPLGLQWGQTVEQLTKMGIQLKKNADKGRLSIYSTTQLPKGISLAEEYLLVFDKQYHLQKISITGKNYTSDPYGTEGKESFKQIEDMLTSKYGQPSEQFHKTGLKLYEDGDEFYECLRYTGCGYWSSFWKVDGENRIQLTLKGLSYGTGYLVISYEGPQWSQAIDAHEAEQSNADQDAL